MEVAEGAYGFSALRLLGYLATAIISAVEGAVTVGGLSALGAALYGIGTPRDSVLDYEADVKADSFLVVAHGSNAEMERARTILHTADPARLHLHSDRAEGLAAERALDAVG